MNLTGKCSAIGGQFCVLALAGTMLATPVAAQDKSFLEEIVVVAQKREQNIMDVPVAVSSVSGAEIEESAIKDMFDLQQNVPGLIVGQSQTTTTSNFAIRGVGSTSNNFGVESSVGLYVDGVYRSRQSSMVNELIDVKAVEVLRGPQGTLFGKNTASGAINVLTVAPSTDGNDAYIEVGAGDFDLARVNGAANIVLTDNLAFRGTFFTTQRDGYVDDDVMGPDLYNNRDRFGLRAQVGYDNGDDFNMRIIGDYSEIDEMCCVGLSRVDAIYAHDPAAQGIYIPGADYVRMLLGNTVYTDYPYPAQVLAPNVVTGVGFEDYRTTLNYAPRSQNEESGLSLELNKTMENGVTLTSITAYRTFDTLDFIDADFTDTEILTRTNKADQHSLSEELRFAGEFGDASNWVVGVYYFEEEIRSQTETIGGAELQAYVDIAEQASGGIPPSLVTDAVTLYSQLAASQGVFFPPGAPAFPDGLFAFDDVLQDHQSIAVFGQLEWALSDAFALTIGGRYTDEKKTINADYTQTNPGTAVPDVDAITAILLDFQQGIPPADPTPLLAVAQPNVGWGSWLYGALAPRPNVAETLKDDQWTGTLKLTWFMNDAMMTYLSWSNGYKAGGTNTDRIYPQFDQLFGPETSESIELGFKGDLGERFRLQVALYNTDYDDFQANSFTGSGFNLQNAGKLDTQGIEVEYTWEPWDNTTIDGYFAYNEGEYAEFNGGTCWIATPFHTQQPDPGLAPGADPDTSPCTRTGDRIPYNPENRAFLALTQNFPMGNSEFFVRLEYTYVSDLLTDGDDDPLTLQDSFGLLNATIGWNIDSWNSTLSLWGRNLTDERVYSGSYDPPLLDGRMNSYPGDPATWGIRFRKNWD